MIAQSAADAGQPLSEFSPIQLQEATGTDRVGIGELEHDTYVQSWRLLKSGMTRKRKNIPEGAASGDGSLIVLGAGGGVDRRTCH